MINAMTVITVMALLSGLAGLVAWASHDRFTTSSHPAWFD